MTDSRRLPTSPDAGGLARSLSGMEFLRALMDGTIPAPAFASTCRIRPIEVAHGRVVFEGEPKGDFYNPLGVVHGGWIATLLDTGMASAVHSALKAGETFTTLSMTTTFVKPVLEQSGPLRCEGMMLHGGGRVASAEGKVYDANGNLVAHGTEACLIIKAARGP